MQQILTTTALAGLAASLASAACTTYGQPVEISLASHVVEIQDATAYRTGREVWIPAAIKADSQLFTWLVWSNFPGGQGCTASFTGVHNDTCRSRVDIQFQQRTAYNVGISVSDMAGESAVYPYSCSLELEFHIFDRNATLPNPRFDPDDPNSGEPWLTDPGFNFYTQVTLAVTGEHYVNPGGVATVPIGMKRDGCPEMQPGDEFPAFMLEGPGCASVPNGPARTGYTWGASTTVPPRSLASPAVPLGARGPQTATAIREAAKAKLSTALAQVSARATRLHGRPVLTTAK